MLCCVFKSLANMHYLRRTPLHCVYFILGILFVTCEVFSLNIPSQVRRPPTITEQPSEIFYTLPLKQIRLKCAADALPAVKQSKGYYWKKDGELLNISEGEGRNDTKYRIIMSDVDGSIVFDGSERMNLEERLQLGGKYQCFASNEWGTSISELINMKIGIVPYFQPADEVLEVNEGEPKQVPCRKSTTDDVEYWWNFSPENVQMSNRIAQASDGTLVFSNIVAEMDQDLKFYCTLKYLPTRSSIDGAYYILSVNTDKPARTTEPEIIRPKEDNMERVILRGTELKLTCIAVGNPTPSVSWTKIGQNLDEDEEDRYEMLDFNRTLIIRDVKDEDEGDYSCTAINDEGIATRGVKITVQSKPYFRLDDQQPTDMIKVPGESATIRCAPVGTPDPQVEWMMNGLPLNESNKNPRSVILRNRIVINNLNESDTAVYQCVGKNKHGIVMGQGFLNVMTSPPFALPQNTKFYRKMEGSAVAMECNMFASPAAEQNWTKLEEPEKVLVDDSRVKLKKSKTLKIENLNLDDTGTYKCVATNKYGAASINVSLLVLSSTEVRPREESGTYYAPKGTTAHMMVEIITHPNLTWRSVEWYKDGNMFGRELQLTILDVSLQDGGKYKVLVKTDLDQAITDVNLVVQDVPDEPMDAYFTPSESDAFSGVLNWEKPLKDNNAAIETYRVEYEATRLFPGKWKTFLDTAEGTETRAEIPELEPWVSYSFRVWARNKVGWSNIPSEPTPPYVTPSKEPSTNPTGVKGEGTAPDNMVISWDAVDPMKFSGPGFGYEIRWCLKSSCTWELYFETNASITSYTVEGTPPYTSYLINVTSANDNGTAPLPETVVGYSGEDVPLAAPSDPKSEIGDEGKVRISWTPVPEDKMRGLVTGYQVRSTKKGTNESLNTYVDPNELSVEIDLEPYTDYEITVTATNSVGASAPSTVIRLRTPEGLPEAVEEFKVTSRTLTDVMLSWNEPNKKNGIIKGYMLNYIWNEGNETKKMQNETTSLKMKVLELAAGTEYTLTLCAATSRGYSPDCAVLLTSTLTPKPPRVPEYHVITDESVANVSWIPSEEDEADGMPAKFFFVKHRLANKENDDWKESEWVPVEPGKWHYASTVRNLKPGSPYEFRLIAINEYGNTTTNSTIFATAGSLKQVADAGILNQTWFIVIMVVVPVIIFVIVIICFVRRRKGGKYSVSEKEEQLVKLESQPMNNDDAGKYSVNQSDDTVKGENGASALVNDPLQSRRTRGDSVGGNSIEAFGSGDTRDFEEDGSFIDQYGVERRSHGKSEGVGSPVSDDVKDVTNAESKLLPESELSEN